MRPPLSSRSSTKLRGSKIRACSHIDLGEFLFWWRNCHWGEKNRKILFRFLEFPSVKFRKIWQRSYSLLAFLAFNLSEKFVRQGFRLAKFTKNGKNEKATSTTPTFFDFKSFFLPDSTRFEHIRQFYRTYFNTLEDAFRRTKRMNNLRHFRKHSTFTAN